MSLPCGHYRRLGDPLPFLPHLYVSPPLAPSLPLPCSSTSTTYYIVFLLPASSPIFSSPLPSTFPSLKNVSLNILWGRFLISVSLFVHNLGNRNQKQKQATREEIYTVVLVLIVVYGQWSMSLRFPCPLLSWKRQYSSVISIPATA